MNNFDGSRRVGRGAISAAALLFVVAACGSSPESPADGMSTPRTSASSMTESMSHGPSDTEQSMTSSAPTGPARQGTTIAAGKSEFGTILFDGTGQAIYLFDVEKTATPACYDVCATAWPPVLTDAAPVAGDGVQRALLGTTARSDGTVQVTYGGHPLYFYAHEGKHEVKCHNVFLNRGNWYVVQADGMAAPAA